MHNGTMANDAQHLADSGSKLENFKTWLEQRPGAHISPKIKVVQLQASNAGRGVVAIADINDEEELFTVPLVDVLSVESSAFGKQHPDLLERLDSWNSLVLTMIFEDGQGDDSHWWPYLDILPTVFDTLIHWTPTELAELSGSAVLDKIGKKEAEDSFLKILLPIVQTYPEIFGKHEAAFRGTQAKNVLLELAHRMATLIMACGFDLENEPSSGEYDEADGSSQSAYELNKGMVPLADLLNADADRNNAHLVQNEAAVTMVAIKPIKQGEEIYNDYGPLPRSDLLRRYGYVTDRYKKWDVVEISIDSVIESCKNERALDEKEKKQRLQLAAQWEVLQDGYDLTRPQERKKFEFEDDLLLTITALLLNAEDYVQAVDSEEALNKPPTNIQWSLCHVLKSIISRRNQAFRTTIAEDVSLLESSATSGRKRMAVDVRLGEKEILAIAAAEVDKRLAKLSDPEDESQTTGSKKRKI